MWYIAPESGQGFSPGQTLAHDYFPENLPVVEERMFWAGVGLAKVLNECFAAE